MTDKAIVTVIIPTGVLDEFLAIVDREPYETTAIYVDPVLGLIHRMTRPGRSDDDG